MKKLFESRCWLYVALVAYVLSGYTGNIVLIIINFIGVCLWLSVWLRLWSLPDVSLLENKTTYLVLDTDFGDRAIYLQLCPREPIPGNNYRPANWYRCDKATIDKKEAGSGLVIKDDIAGVTSLVYCNDDQ